MKGEKVSLAWCSKYLTKVLMPMLEYVEGCMVNDGNYYYMSG